MSISSKKIMAGSPDLRAPSNAFLIFFRSAFPSDGLPRSISIIFRLQVLAITLANSVFPVPVPP